MARERLRMDARRMWHGTASLVTGARVLLWAAIGGSGFLVVVLGILLTSLGLWRARAA